MDRISNYLLKTVSGKVIILIGNMKLRVDSGKLCYVCKYIKTLIMDVLQGSIFRLFLTF